MTANQDPSSAMLRNATGATLSQSYSSSNSRWTISRLFTPPPAIILILNDGSARIYSDEVKATEVAAEYPGCHVTSATSPRAALPHETVLRFGSTYQLTRRGDDHCACQPAGSRNGAASATDSTNPKHTGRCAADHSASWRHDNDI